MWTKYYVSVITSSLVNFKPTHAFGGECNAAIVITGNEAFVLLEPCKTVPAVVLPLHLVKMCCSHGKKD